MQLLLLCFWWSVLFISFIALVLVVRTLSRLVELKLDLSALYCSVVSHVLLVLVLLLYSLSLSCSEQSVQLKGSARHEISIPSEPREIPA